MFTQNIINNYLQIPGIDGMILAMPEIFIFCSTLILMILDIFFFKEKSFKNTNKFWIFIIIIALFLAIGVIYERTHTRDINKLGDFATTMPKYSVFLMFFTLGSVGLPGTSGFIGEVLVLIGSWKVNPLVAIISGLSLILGAIYMLRFYRKISFGISENQDKYEIHDVNIREFMILIPLVIFIILFGIFPNIVLNFLKVPHFLILETFK